MARWRVPHRLIVPTGTRPCTERHDRAHHPRGPCPSGAPHPTCQLHPRRRPEPWLMQRRLRRLLVAWHELHEKGRCPCPTTPPPPARRRSTGWTRQRTSSGCEPGAASRRYRLLIRSLGAGGLAARRPTDRLRRQAAERCRRRRRADRTSGHQSAAILSARCK